MRKTYSDEEALQLLRAGREQGLAILFERYYTSLTCFALRLVEDSFLAEEITSEAFVKLWNVRSQLSLEGSIKAWLYATVRHAAIDHLRKVKRLRTSEQQHRGLNPEAVEQTVLHRMIEAETVGRVIRTLDGLPPGCRKVFQLFYLQGRSCEEIARVLRVSPHTVRNQRIRAVRLLKKKVRVH